MGMGELESRMREEAMQRERNCREQGRRQGVTTENYSWGPQAKGGPGGAPEVSYGRNFFFSCKTQTFFVISGPYIVFLEPNKGTLDSML